MTSGVPPLRIRAVNDAPVREPARWVVYWMTAARRTTANFALERAADWARELGLPLVVLEALRCDYRWASDRLHGFILDGMADNAQRFAAAPALYYPYVEPELNAGKGLLAAVSREASLVVTQSYTARSRPGQDKADSDEDQ